MTIRICVPLQDLGRLEFSSKFQIMDFRAFLSRPKELPKVTKSGSESRSMLVMLRIKLPNSCWLAMSGDLLTVDGDYSPTPPLLVDSIPVVGRLCFNSIGSYFDNSR